jgi:hypothetical protein
MHMNELFWAGSKIPTMSECISSLKNLLKTMQQIPLTGQF